MKQMAQESQSPLENRFPKCECVMQKRTKWVSFITAIFWFTSKLVEPIISVQFGFTYRDLENDGVFMPVTESFCRYDRSAYYDDVLEIVTTLEMVSRLKLQFNYEVITK